MNKENISKKIIISVISLNELEVKLSKYNLSINDFKLFHVLERQNGDFEINEVSAVEAKKILIDYVEVDIENMQININDSLCV